MPSITSLCQTRVGFSQSDPDLVLARPIMGGFIHLISMVMDTCGGTSNRLELRTKGGAKVRGEHLCTRSIWCKGARRAPLHNFCFWKFLPLCLDDIDVNERILPTSHGKYGQQDRGLRRGHSPLHTHTGPRGGTGRPNCHGGVQFC